MGYRKTEKYFITLKKNLSRIIASKFVFINSFFA